MKQEIEQRVVALTKELNLELPATASSNSATVLDSMGMLELIVGLEKTFGLDLMDDLDAHSKLNSIESVVGLVLSKSE